MNGGEFQAYDSDSGSQTSSQTSSQSSGTSDSERDIHDKRLDAVDRWRQQATAWISTPTPPLLPRPDTQEHVGHVTDLPAELRGNDIRRQIICIDSQFRDDPETSASSNFYFSLLTPVRNVMRIRVTSVEFPNNYPFFTVLRRNVSFQVLWASGPTPITIPRGNYSAFDMETVINAALVAAGLSWLSVVFTETAGTFTFTAAPIQSFTIDTTYGSWTRPFAYGLGYYLGFTRSATRHASDVSGQVTSDQCATFAGDNYIFLKMNTYECVRQTVQENEFSALAKIVLREPKNYMTFDDYASQHIKEVVFQTPVDLTRFQIQILDPYGEVLDMCSSQWSFSLEVLELKNRELYDTVRDSLMLRYV